MDKLKLAHEYALEMAKQGIPLKSCKELGWKYADAMQAEADKRKPSGFPEALREVDWRVAPTWARYWVIRNDSDTALWCINKPTVTGDCLLSHGGCSPAPSFGFTGSHIVERPNGFQTQTQPKQSQPTNPG